MTCERTINCCWTHLFCSSAVFSIAIIFEDYCSSIAELDNVDDALAQSNLLVVDPFGGDLDVHSNRSSVVVPVRVVAVAQSFFKFSILNSVFLFLFICRVKYPVRTSYPYQRSSELLPVGRRRRKCLFLRFMSTITLPAIAVE